MDITEIVSVTLIQAILLGSILSYVSTRVYAAYRNKVDDLVEESREAERELTRPLFYIDKEEYSQITIFTKDGAKTLLPGKVDIDTLEEIMEMSLQNGMVLYYKPTEEGFDVIDMPSLLFLSSIAAVAKVAGESIREESDKLVDDYRNDKKGR